jgi:lipid-binding SYLF domain-containing protein
LHSRFQKESSDSQLVGCTRNSKGPLDGEKQGITTNRVRKSIAMKYAATLLGFFLVALFSTGCSHHHVTTTAAGKTVYGEKAASIERLRDAGSDLTQLMNAPDSSIPKEVLDAAKCIAIVPDMVKGGFVVGAQHGRGVATCKTANGWSDPAFFVVTGGTWGAQIGVEGVDMVMLIMNDKGMQDLLSSEFKLGAGASVAAGPVGRQAQASTDWKLNSEVLVYSRAHGLYAGMDLSGAVIKPDFDATVGFYGKQVPSNVLLHRKASNPNDAVFLTSVEHAVSEARAS